MNSKSFLPIAFLLMTAITASGCEAIGAIFKAGVWTGIIAVVFIVAIIIFIVSKLFSKNKNG